MIPENKKNAVANALQTTFGVNEFEEIHEMTAGLSSALVCRIVVLGKPYLLKIITRTDAIADPTYQFTCMKAAAEAGIAPHVWYLNIEDRISITDFIKATPLSVNDATLKFPALLKQLHALPPFPHKINYLDVMNGLVQKFHASNIMPADMSSHLLRHYTTIKNIYPRTSDDLVSCHNDLKPDNMLFDGERVWIADWESAFLNDRYLDLAVMGNFVIANSNDEKNYLKKYFGKDLSEYHHARFFLMQQLLHFFYFSFLLPMVAGAAGDTPIDFNIPKPGFRAFHDLLWTGKMNITTADAKLQYALVHMEQLLHNLQLKRFDDSLKIVSSHKWQ